jgi:hypothetical protein
MNWSTRLYSKFAQIATGYDPNPVGITTSPLHFARVQTSASNALTVILLAISDQEQNAGGIGYFEDG